jgi:hypothetical protein
MDSNFIFQIDNSFVCNEYKKDNFKIVIDESIVENSCALYFCSHDIYFPNEESVFVNKIVERNFYEWFKIRLKNVRKHIFLRDIHKQWYLSGINAEINSPEKILKFLQFETRGFKVTALGSSAGGYAAVLYGSLLKADKIFSFNGQMELNSLLKSSSGKENPLLFKFENTDLRKYFDLKPFLINDVDIFYFYSKKSTWDVLQVNHIAGSAIERIGFNTAHHGIPFFKCSLHDVLNSSKDELLSFSKKNHNPILFSIRCSGLWRVSIFCIGLLYTIGKNKISFFSRGTS